MTEEKNEKPKFDNSWDAWSFRFGMVLVACMVLFLFFMMFVDAALNPQCRVLEFIEGKCNRFDRKFVPWDKLEKERGKSSFLQIEGDGLRHYITTVQRAAPDSRST